MATTSFNVTVDEVLEDTPHIQKGNITSTSNPVNTGMVEGYIDSASSDMAALVRKNGQDPEQLSDDATEQIRKAVRAYAVKEIMQAMGAVEEKYRQYKEKWRHAYEKYDKQPSRMDGHSTEVHSNVSKKDDHPFQEDFTSHDYEF